MQDSLDETHARTEAGHDVVIPVSAGVPPLVVVACLVGLVMILAVVGIVLANSSFGHVWPSGDSPRIELKQ